MSATEYTVSRAYLGLQESKAGEEAGEKAHQGLPAGGGAERLGGSQTSGTRRPCFQNKMSCAQVRCGRHRILR